MRSGTPAPQLPYPGEQKRPRRAWCFRSAELNGTPRTYTQTATARTSAHGRRRAPTAAGADDVTSATSAARARVPPVRRPRGAARASSSCRVRWRLLSAARLGVAAHPPLLLISCPSPARLAPASAARTHTPSPLAAPFRARPKCRRRRGPPAPRLHDGTDRVTEEGPPCVGGGSLLTSRVCVETASSPSREPDLDYLRNCCSGDPRPRPQGPSPRSICRDPSGTPSGTLDLRGLLTPQGPAPKTSRTLDLDLGDPI